MLFNSQINNLQVDMHLTSYAYNIHNKDQQ